MIRRSVHGRGIGRTQGQRIGAGRSAQPEVDAIGVERRERAELLGDDDRHMRLCYRWARGRERRGRTIAALAVGSVALAACTPYGNARTVRETKTGGEIALEGQREIAQQKADAAMAAKCPNGFEVDEQGESVVGQATDSQTKPKQASLFSGPGTTTQTASRDVTEWRIKYHCKGAEEQPEQKASPTDEAQPQSREQHTLILRF